jgi:hypothetical protein
MSFCLATNHADSLPGNSMAHNFSIFGAVTNL